MGSIRQIAWLTISLFLASASVAHAAVLEVGEGKAFTRIEAAYDRAQPGDEIQIYPLTNNRAYERTALRVRKARLRFRGIPDAERKLPRLDGTGYVYSGEGSVPRAVFQFDAGGSGGSVESLEITGAHNGSHNGAAVRINAGNEVTVRACDIHGNDMGIMSNGDAAAGTGANQRILNCHIHHNGAPEDPGYNHNLYLGGTSAHLVGCEIDHSLTGHNFKSRAHYNRLEACFIHDSANREMDFVDDGTNTARPNSHAVVVGCIIVKAREMSGNRMTIHFGQDGGHAHNGTLYLVHNTIVTPYLAPVVEISASEAGVTLYNNLITDGGEKQAGQVLISRTHEARAERVSGSHNWLSGGFVMPPDVRLTDTRRGSSGVALAFRRPEVGDYRLAAQPNGGSGGSLGGLAWDLLRLPDEAGMETPVSRLLQYAPERKTEERPVRSVPAIGAFP